MQTTGTQILNRALYDADKTANGVTFTKQADGSILLTGKNTGTATFYLGEYIDILEDGETYTYQSNSPLGTLYITYNGEPGPNYITTVTVDKSRMTSIRPYIQYNLKNPIVNNMRIFPMINKGTVKKPWEPYTGGKPSPSMEYPQEIVNAGDNGNIKVEVTGRNLFPLIEDNIVKNSPLTATINSDGSISIYGTPLKRYESVFITQLIDFHPGTYYLGGGIFEKGKLIVQLNIVRNDDSVEYISNKSFELKKDDKKRSLSIQYSSAELIPVNQIIYPLLVYGAENVPFEPYKQPQTLTLKTPDGLPGIPVKSGGNYTDSTGQQWITDEIDLSRGEKVQRVGNIIFDGSDDEKWSFIQGGLKSRAVIAIQNIDSGARCNSFGYCESLESESEPSGMFDLGSGRYFRFGIYGLCNSVEEWRTLLQTEPVEVLYILPDSIVTPLSPEEIAAYKALHTYSPNTTITNDAGCEMSLTYTADTKKYVDKKIAAISAAE